MVSVRFAFWMTRLTARLLFTLLLLVTILLVAYTSFWLPSVSILAEENPETTAFIERARERGYAKDERLEIKQIWVPLDRMSPHLIEAVRIAEDDRFYLHNGFDFTEIRNALEENLRAGKWVRGGSTLTQQLAKNLYLYPQKNFHRKLDEMLLTWKLEQSLTKERILEVYLNVVEWGHGCFGAEAASRFYFLKPCRSLTAEEAANLAARLPNPDYLGSHSGEKRRKARQEIILARMKTDKTPGLQPRKATDKKGTEPVEEPVEDKAAPVKESPSGRFERLVSLVSTLTGTLRDRGEHWLQKSDTLEVGVNGAEEIPPPADRGSRTTSKEGTSAEESAASRTNHKSDPRKTPGSTASGGKVEEEAPSVAPRVAQTKTIERPVPPAKKKSSELLQKLAQLEKAWSE